MTMWLYSGPPLLEGLGLGKAKIRGFQLKSAKPSLKPFYPCLSDS